jgi:hypothetical protein
MGYDYLSEEKQERWEKTRKYLEYVQRHNNLDRVGIEKVLSDILRRIREGNAIKEVEEEIIYNELIPLLRYIQMFLDRELNIYEKDFDFISDILDNLGRLDFDLDIMFNSEKDSLNKLGNEIPF